MSQNAPEHSDPAEKPVFRTTRARFEERGYFVSPPEALTDTQLPGRLWELIYAAAASGLYFIRTDHLSDRQLYILLWEQWLDELYPDFENCREENEITIVSNYDAVGLSAEEIERLYYSEEPLCMETPTRVDSPRSPGRPYDRDRFLPISPGVIEGFAGWVPDDGEPDEQDEAEGEDDIPQDNEDDATGDFGAEAGVSEDDDADEAWKTGTNEDQDGVESVYGSAVDDDGDEDEEEDEDSSDTDKAEFLKELEGMEPENWVSPAQTLIKENIPLLPPSEITSETLGPILWELLHNLALQGFYILHSDHLSDRELYSELWKHGLREPAHLPGRSVRGGWFHDFLGSWSDEDMQLWLKYYATDEERAHHSSEYPEDSIPAHVEPCSQRDWRLPKGPF